MWSTPRAHVMPEEHEECFKVRYAQLPITAAPLFGVSISLSQGTPEIDTVWAAVEVYPGSEHQKIYCLTLVFASAVTGMRV